jgi:hypothetical protein
MRRAFAFLAMTSRGSAVLWSRNGEVLGGTMIKRLHELYVGQTDLDNVGLNGTPAKAACGVPKAQDV